MAELKGEIVEFPACHLVAKKLNIRWQHLIFILIHYVHCSAV